VRRPVNFGADVVWALAFVTLTWLASSALGEREWGPPADARALLVMAIWALCGMFLAWRALPRACMYTRHRPFYTLAVVVGWLWGASYLAGMLSLWRTIDRDRWQGTVVVAVVAVALASLTAACVRAARRRPAD